MCRQPRVDGQPATPHSAPISASNSAHRPPLLAAISPSLPVIDHHLCQLQ